MPPSEVVSLRPSSVILCGSLILHLLAAVALLRLAPLWPPLWAAPGLLLVSAVRDLQMRRRRAEVRVRWDAVEARPVVERDGARVPLRAGHCWMTADCVVLVLAAGRYACEFVVVHRWQLPAADYARLRRWLRSSAAVSRTGRSRAA